MSEPKPPRSLVWRLMKLYRVMPAPAAKRAAKNPAKPSRRRCGPPGLDPPSRWTLAAIADRVDNATHSRIISTAQLMAVTGYSDSAVLQAAERLIAAGLIDKQSFKASRTRRTAANYHIFVSKIAELEALYRSGSEPDQDEAGSGSEPDQKSTTPASSTAPSGPDRVQVQNLIGSGPEPEKGPLESEGPVGRAHAVATTKGVPPSEQIRDLTNLTGRDHARGPTSAEQTIRRALAHHAFNGIGRDKLGKRLCQMLERGAPLEAVMAGLRVAVPELSKLRSGGAVPTPTQGKSVALRAVLDAVERAAPIPSARTGTA